MSNEINIGDMKAILIGMMLFSGFLLGFQTFHNSLAEAHGADTYDFEQYSVLTDTTDMVQDMSDTAEEGQESLLDKIAQAYALGIWALDILKLPFSTIWVAYEMASDIVTVLYAPAWLVALLGGIVVITILFAFLKGALKVG